MATTRRVDYHAAQVNAAQKEYDIHVFPGFLRQNMSKWLDDGTSAPSGRARGKADQFQLAVGKAEIDEDINEILEKTGQVQGGAKRRSHTKFKISG